jgi:hypothetical protein
LYSAFLLKDSGKLKAALGAIVSASAVMVDLSLEDVARAAKEAAERNGNKRDHRMETVRFWQEKLDEEIRELYKAVLNGVVVRMWEEVGDVVWSGTALVDRSIYPEPLTANCERLEDLVE